MTPNELKDKLTRGMILEHNTLKNKIDGKPQRFKITVLKVYGKDSTKIRIGLRRGMNQFASIDSVESFFNNFSL